ncbi:caudovirus prohead protease [Clostridia bacterium]|nr:caudovirus prohead protease [Clostridia bacterium]
MARNRNDLTRELSGIKALAEDESGNSFELSFSSEEPYTRWFGTEIMDHSEGAADLSRLNDIGCVLFNHDRDAVLAKIDRAWIEEGRGKAVITFDDDELAAKIKKKIESGTLKGVSVSYAVDNWESVAAGKASTDGRFQGPCEIARKWTAYEISVVSVPADPTVGIGRQHNDQGTQLSLDLYEKQLNINKNYFGGVL